jgi:nitric oxide reductase activation protein
MRLPFNPRTWRMHAAYRDDGSWLWEPEAQAPASDTTLAANPPPAEAQPEQGVAFDPAPPVLYPEWDERVGRYRPDWCRVYTRTASVGPRPLPPVPAGEQRRLAQALGALRGGPPRPAGRASWGDEFHSMALLDARLQRRAGQAPDPHVYRRRVAPPQRLAVQVLLDTSASTGDRCGDGRPLLAHMLGASLACTAALEDLGHRSALAAFASRTRHRVELQHVKHWDDAATAPVVLARCGAQYSSGSTRLGAALRHAAADALAEVRLAPGVRPVVLLFSDGEAHDVDAPDPAYLRGDLRRAIAEAEAAGVAVRCLLVQPPGAPAAPGRLRGFPAGRRALLRHGTALPSVLATLLAA